MSVVGCGGAAPALAPTPQSGSAPAPAAPDRTRVDRPAPVLPPHVAYLAGLMPLRSTGVDSFRVAQPSADGRGVLIAILDSGIDAGLPGLQQTTQDQPKLFDLRDFSGEGRIALHPVPPDAAGGVIVEGHRLTGFGRVLRMSTGPFYGGVLRELDLGTAPAADVNGNGTITDELPLLVGKSTSGWFLVTDTDGDGALDDETPLRDYLLTRETFTYGAGPITFAVNLEERDGRPVLDLFFDNSGHGSHVSGIAAGHDLFGVDGFDGVAPGAQLLGLKISNNARGGISVTGSMLRAMNYAADVAARRNVPLVLNLSFGVGNEYEGTAAIDSMVNEFTLKHPDMLFVISAGNDGPGLSTMGFPGSAEYALTVCALYPGVFVRAPVPGVPPAPDAIGWWSARGGELAKPDLCAPGIAFSNVPPWSAGEEISGGTSMAAPHVAGLAALLLSGSLQSGRRVRAIDLRQALIATAQPIEGGTVLDEGAGVPNVVRAYRWLEAAHQTGVYAVRAVTLDSTQRGWTAAYRRNGLEGPGDTIQRFEVRSMGGQPAARLLLRSDTPWLHAPAAVEPRGAPVSVTVTYDARELRRPGVYEGTVWARPATDTMAGPSFGLTNTVIVPHDLSSPVQVEGNVAAGQVARTFLRVPAGAAGLDVHAAARGRASKATLHLFEPGGQPYRGGGEAPFGSGEPGSIAVETEDLQPGVYEAIVAAPPDGAITYDIEAAVPAIAVLPLGGWAAVIENRSEEPQTAAVTPELLGVARRTEVRGLRDEPHVLRVAVPAWSAGVVVDVALPGALWQRLTDFGVTLFDGTGRKLADGPLHYAFGRVEVPWDSSAAPDTITIELLPAYAHLEPAARWHATVQVAFELPERQAVRAVGQSAVAQVTLDGGERRTLDLLTPAGFVPPPGFDAWIEVSVADGAGFVARQRGTIAVSSDPQPEGQQ